MIRLLVIAAALVAITTSALAFGLGREGARGGFGSLGSMGKVTPAAVISTCNGTGLIFNGANGACNSQYIGIL
jgi:hypothetical protein